MAWSSFPVTAAMGDFDEASARLIEQGKRFGATFDRAGFVAMGSMGNEISGQGQPEIIPPSAARLLIGRTGDGVAVWAQGIERAWETQAWHLQLMGRRLGPSHTE